VTPKQCAPHAYVFSADSKIKRKTYTALSPNCKRVRPITQELLFRSVASLNALDLDGKPHPKISILKPFFKSTVILSLDLSQHLQGPAAKKRLLKKFTKIAKVSRKTQ